jgi:hypothetical protein
MLGRVPAACSANDAPGMPPVSDALPRGGPYRFFGSFIWSMLNGKYR